MFFLNSLRYVKLLPAEVVPELSFRFFKQNVASEGFMARARVTEDDSNPRIYATCFLHFQCTSSTCKCFPWSNLFCSQSAECLICVAFLVICEEVNRREASVVLLPLSKPLCPLRELRFLKKKPGVFLLRPSILPQGQRFRTWGVRVGSQSQQTDKRWG